MRWIYVVMGILLFAVPGILFITFNRGLDGWGSLIGGVVFFIVLTLLSFLAVRHSEASKRKE